MGDGVLTKVAAQRLEDQPPANSAEHELAEARAEITRLRSQLAEARRPLIVPQGTPFADYLASKTELSMTAHPSALRSMSALLEEYRVRVTPAEGDWILERFAADDWSRFPGANDPVRGGIPGVLLHFLGAQRVLADTGPDPWRPWLDDEEWRYVFGSDRPAE